ncbi:hypothetical protein [Aquipuribacter sp. MA13-6]|uniref:hypothetical protein n=1 Tax=unclassified Aquipuribacter TaxID=2635084 RepID=UPI003EED92FF
MRPGPVRRALGRAPRAAVAAVAGAVLLAGCASDTAPTRSEQTQDPDMAEPSDATEPSDGAEPPVPTEPDATGPDATGPDATGPDATGPPGATTEPTGSVTGALTEQDSGTRVDLAVGEELPLRLGSAWSWSEPVVDGAAVTLTPVDFLVDPGYVEWLVTGTAPGAATLEVVGEPVCGDTTVCPPTTVTLDVAVTD